MSLSGPKPHKNIVLPKVKRYEECDLEHLESEAALQWGPYWRVGGRIETQFSGAGMHTPPTGKKACIVPLSGRATAKGDTGAGGRMKGSVSYIASDHWNPTQKNPPHCPDLKHCEDWTHKGFLCFVLLSCCAVPYAQISDKKVHAKLCLCIFFVFDNRTPCLTVTLITLGLW